MASTSDPSPKTKTLLIGLSGPSSSGKTTLARFLRSIFNVPASEKTKGRDVKLFILHEDDFYLTDKEIPLVTVPTSPNTTNPSGLPSRTVQDWDCVQSLDLPLFESTLRHLKQHGRLPDDMFSKEDQNEIGPTSVPEELINSLQEQVKSWLANLPLETLPADHSLSICVLDGFLLYPNPDPGTTELATKHLYKLSQMLDMKLWVSCSRKQMIDRRTKRSGYVTLEGFWADPEGYVEDVVWVNFVRDHEWLCSVAEAEKDAGEGALLVNEESAKGEGIIVAPGSGNLGMEDLVRWAVGVVGERMRAQR